MSYSFFRCVLRFTESLFRHDALVVFHDQVVARKRVEALYFLLFDNVVERGYRPKTNSMLTRDDDERERMVYRVCR